VKFSFTDEQSMLRDTAEAFLASVSDSTSVRSAMQSPLGFDQGCWQRICSEMYWQGILVPESCDGLSLGVVEMTIAFEQIGRRLTPSPLYASALGVVALRSLDESARQQALLKNAAEGQVIALAHTSARSNWDTVDVQAQKGPEGWILTGEARFVSCGHGAQTLLVVADNGGQESLFAVDAAMRGVTVSKTPTMDQTRPMASLHLDSVALDEDAMLSENWGASRRTTLDIGRIFVGAEQVGCAQESLDSSVAYVGERVQFGRTIASYQAIKHKAADMMLKVESARSLLYFAACIADEWLAGDASDGDLAEAASMLSSSAGDAAFFCAGTGIQLHGGVGITEEYDIQLYFKRARSTESYLGRPDEHREAIAKRLLDEDASHAA
jgi:alkylation response protein AidB-like acyl-CoA dehydrogenase